MLGLRGARWLADSGADWRRNSASRRPRQLLPQALLMKGFVKSSEATNGATPPIVSHPARKPGAPPIIYAFVPVFHRARSDYSELLSAACGCIRIMLAGVSDTAEIAMIYTMNDGMQVGGVVDPNSTGNRIANSMPSSLPTSTLAGTPMRRRSSASGGGHVLALSLIGLSARSAATELV
jgi:hypothetical protein